MQRSHRRWVVVVVLFLVATVGTTGLAAADGTPGPDGNVTVTDATAESTVTEPARTDGIQSALPSAGYDTDGSIVVTQEYRLTPDQPGRIDVQWRFEVPSSVSEVWTRLPADATNVRTTRFELGEDGRYEWTGEESSGSVTFTRPVNETTTQTGPEATSGRYKFVDAGEWALFQRRSSVPVGYRYRGSNPGVTFRNATGSDGIVGNGLVYLGPYDLATRRAHGQTFRLVVPRGASLAEDRTEILDSVADASDRLRVGDRDARVTMFAAPTTVSWGFRGLQTGDSDFYVLDDESLDTADSTWLHEYVHTRQDINHTESTRWVLEASAEYYAAQLALEQDRIDYQAFREHLERGTRRRFEDVRLVDPATYRSNGGNYVKGALVSGDLDRRIRLATDSSATFQDVFRRLNRQTSPVDQSDFLGYVRERGGTSVADAARRYTETTATPTTWSQSTHQEAFGALPARFTYSLPERGSDDIRVRSVYRDGLLGDTGLVTGETLVLGVNVTNVGGTGGEYDLSVTVDGSSVASRSGRLDGGASTTVTVEHNFTAPGTYSVSTGEDRWSVRVLEPATPLVTTLAADRDQVAPGEEVTLRATVENPADRPGKRQLTIRQAGTEVATRTVRLPPGGKTEVTATVTPQEQGTYQFLAGNETITITVADPGTATPQSTSNPSSATTPTAGSDTTNGEGDDTDTNAGRSGPGFGPVVALLALLAAVLIGHRFQ